MALRPPAPMLKSPVAPQYVNDPSRLRCALNTADVHVLAFVGMNHAASRKSTVPFAFSVKSTTCVPCEYQPMKIRFWPGICCITCAVHSDGCGAVRIGAR